jgi:Kdo2-lipid IVA lauroyltransferase/acyltransferase
LGKSLRRATLYAFVRGLMLLAFVLPRSLALRVFGGLGAWAFLLLRKDRIRAEVNLSLAFPEYSRQEIRDLTRRVYVELGRNCTDVFRFPLLRWQELSRFVKVEGLSYLDEALSRGRGVVAVTGHIGCWELLGAYFSMMGYPLAVIVRPLRDQRLEKLIDGLRRSKGMKPISRVTNVKSAYSWLKRRGVLGVLIDQDTSVKGVFCDFFGRPAYTPAGPAYLALRTGAAVVPMAIQLEEDGTHVVRVKKPIVVPENLDTDACVLSVMQACTGAIEDYIRSRPAQWVWMHERWKTVPLRESERNNGETLRGRKCVIAG